MSVQRGALEQCDLVTLRKHASVFWHVSNELVWSSWKKEWFSGYKHKFVEAVKIDKEDRGQNMKENPWFKLVGFSANV